METNMDGKKHNKAPGQPASHSAEACIIIPEPHNSLNTRAHQLLGGLRLPGVRDRSSSKPLVDMPNDNSDTTATGK